MPALPLVATEAESYRPSLSSGRRRSRTVELVSVLTIAVGTLFAGASEAAEPTREVYRQASNAVLKHLKVVVNKSRTTRLNFPFKEVLVGSNEIADVIPVSDQTLYVLGKKVGTTNVSVFDDSKRLLAVIDVEVTLDTTTLQTKIQETTGSRGIRVQSQNDKVILSGDAADAVEVDRAVSVAEGLAPGGVVNATRVLSPQQVMLKVRFVEIQRAAAREIGLRWEKLGRQQAVRIGAVGRAEPINTGGAGSGVLPVISAAITGNAQFGQILASVAGGGDRQLDLFLSALEEKGVVRRLAEPNLIALSGDTANFLAGGEYPVPVNSTTSSGFPTVTIAFKEYGVGLAFTPTVLNNGLINLKVEPEVSDLDPTNAVSVGGVSVPAIIKRRAKTTVELRDGQTFAIAGLLQAQSQRTIEQFPWLGSLPVIGALFRSAAFQERETELVVIVTPHLVRPGAPGAEIAAPTDSTIPSNDVDLFLLGKTEVKKEVPQFVAAEGGAAVGPYGHILDSH